MSIVAAETYRNGSASSAEPDTFYDRPAEQFRFDDSQSPAEDIILLELADDEGRSDKSTGRTDKRPFPACESASIPSMRSLMR